jgi:hypothetical protein
LSIFPGLTGHEGVEPGGLWIGVRWEADT